MPWWRARSHGSKCSHLPLSQQLWLHVVLEALTRYSCLASSVFHDPTWLSSLICKIYQRTFRPFRPFRPFRDRRADNFLARRLGDRCHGRRARRSQWLTQWSWKRCSSEPKTSWKPPGGYCASKWTSLIILMKPSNKADLHRFTIGGSCCV
jgi:hypothetical protein